MLLKYCLALVLATLPALANKTRALARSPTSAAAVLCLVIFLCAAPTGTALPLAPATAVHSPEQQARLGVGEFGEFGEPAPPAWHMHEPPVFGDHAAHDKHDVDGNAELALDHDDLDLDLDSVGLGQESYMYDQYRYIDSEHPHTTDSHRLPAVKHDDNEAANDIGGGGAAAGFAEEVAVPPPAPKAELEPTDNLYHTSVTADAFELRDEIDSRVLPKTVVHLAVEAAPNSPLLLVEDGPAAADTQQHLEQQQREEEVEPHFPVALSAGQTWAGVYECGGGGPVPLVLSMHSTFEPVLFTFEQRAAGGGGGGRCAFHMRPDESQADEAAPVLRPDHWAKECPGYSMVGLRGTVHDGAYVGVVTTAVEEEEGCGGFALELLPETSSAETAAAAAWAVAADRAAAWRQAAEVEPAIGGPDVGCRRPADFLPGRGAGARAAGKETAGAETAGADGREVLVGAVRTADECTAMVLERAAGAGGASVLKPAEPADAEQTPTGALHELQCFALFGADAIVAHPVAAAPARWKSCLFDPAAVADDGEQDGFDAHGHRGRGGEQDDLDF